MYRPLTKRDRWLLLQCILLNGLLAVTSPLHAQAPDDPPAVATPAVEAPVADPDEPAEAAAEVQVVGAQIAVQAVQVFGEAIVEEGMEVAGEAVQVLAMGMQVDPQNSKLLSKVAVDNALIRRVCKLDEEQVKQLESMDAKWVKGKAAAGKQAGNLAAGVAAGVIRVFAGANAGVQPDNPAESASWVTTAYKTKLKEILKPDQLAEYEKHVKERDDFRRQANAECIVSVLEDRLSLNDTQRKELVQSLSEWAGIQKMQATFYFQNQAYIPNLPPSVLKALTPTQKKILEGMQKADFQFEMFNDGQEAIFITQ